MHSLFEGDSSRFASHGRESGELLNIDRASFPRRGVQSRDANRYRISNSLSPLYRYNRFRRIPRCDSIPFPTVLGEEVTTRDVSCRNNRALPPTRIHASPCKPTYAQPGLVGTVGNGFRRTNSDIRADLQPCCFLSSTRKV